MFGVATTSSFFIFTMGYDDFAQIPREAVSVYKCKVGRINAVSKCRHLVRKARRGKESGTRVGLALKNIDAEEIQGNLIFP